MARNCAKIPRILDPFTMNSNSCSTSDIAETVAEIDIKDMKDMKDIHLSSDFTARKNRLENWLMESRQIVTL